MGKYEYSNNLSIKSLMQTYNPQIYLGQVLFFKARDSFSISSKLTPPEVNLQKLVMGNLEIYEISGTHISMLQEPHIKLLAEKLIFHLEKSLLD